MTTREMLELAAKACGIRLAKWDGSDICWKALDADDDYREWDPLNQDGQNSRMRTKLRITTWLINRNNEYVGVSCEGSDCTRAEEWFSDHTEPDAALRLAALRVAAVMGERM